MISLRDELNDKIAAAGSELTQPDQPTPHEVGFKEVLSRLGPVAPLAVIAGILPGLGGFLLLGTLKWTGPWLRGLEDAGPLPHSGLLLYIAVFALTSGLALLPTYAQSVLGGWAFGKVAGSAAAVGGIVIGAVIASLVARRASGDRVVRLIEEHPKWRAVYQTLVRGGFWKTLAIVTLLRLPPNSPFAITNLVLSATKVSWSVYVLGTLLGIAPRTIIAAVIGSKLSELDFSKPMEPWLVAAGIVVAIIVIAVIGTLANRAIVQVTRGGAEPEA